MKANQIINAADNVLRKLERMSDAQLFQALDACEESLVDFAILHKYLQFRQHITMQDFKISDEYMAWLTSVNIKADSVDYADLINLAATICAANDQCYALAA